MEDDVEPKDEDGVDGRGVSGWDGCVCGLGPVGSSPIFGLVRRSGTFAVVFPTFVLVSRFVTEQYRVNDNFLNVVSSSRRESMVGSVLTRVCVGSGVGGVTMTSPSTHTHTHTDFIVLPPVFIHFSHTQLSSVFISNNDYVKHMNETIND
jgi:hypothetical protein